MTDKFFISIIINSAPSQLWMTLTDAKQMSKWLGEPEMDIKVQTDWEINSPILISGFYHANFENKGKVLQYDKEKRLTYTHLSSVSRLEDKIENYTVLKFLLTPVGRQTQLTISIENFPTEMIRKHFEFYWRTTILNIKARTEDKESL